MTLPFRKTVMLLALSAMSTLALADTPARVGRIALTQGPVNVSTDVGDEATAALVNWPVTSKSQINTGRDGRTEIRIGSTSVRLDSDSSLEVIELDDDSVRLRLHYGSASIRVRNAEVLRGLEVSTPQGQVHMRDVGRIRIDAERVRDTTNVSVFEGVAQVDGGGASLTLRAGKRADMHEDDVRTALAVRDGFDEWALQRDQRDQRTTSDRYVTSEMTGYEELDQYGVWRDDSEYGPLWTPRRVATDWVPYRDGRWTYVEPWGWTWVDNAPWGYAPSHYGRWVMVKQRWSWAPGRNIGRPVWAPALVGWVGGSNWNLSFNDHGVRRAAPAQGWYPLNPGENFVPGYHLQPEHLRYHNRYARPDYRPDRRDGLTVVNLNLFGGREQIVVPRAPRPVLTPQATQNAPFAAPPRPQGNWSNRFDRDGDGRPDRNGPGRVITVPPNGAQPVLPFSRRDGRPSDNERLVRTPPQVPRPVVTMPAPQVLTPGEPQRSLAEKERRQREAEIERRERDLANERRQRDIEADGRRLTEGQQRQREAEQTNRQREAEIERLRGAESQRQQAIANERHQRETDAQLQAQRDMSNRQQAERQQRDTNLRLQVERVQRDAEVERRLQAERQQRDGDNERRQQAERQQRDADNARRQQAERQQHDAENARRQQAERQQQVERQARDADNERRQQAERQQREAAAAAASRQTQQAQPPQAQQVQQQLQKQAEQAEKRERAKEDRQDRRNNIQQEIR
ncbi:DUF6600 domain-containing protein [Massilia antarctica]|uniref:DUF6600 domain-containing protein n=1 Tax=Massilia antarctica TaxID=2765360 RepID=UPI0006BB79BA|nr:DUF6600 domain-containing protein [Massilia sp. H27-R4]MCY0912254.1 hypothetical protein [Massilia sp. H27-R4]CUI06250.1 hypothetical protein BN2497_7277 [Janthinobacterium sp. CG23_2]CUU30036.1 hypothetical protein BN3177_7277 [Janthinobacterium sp. CG23_2]